MAKEQVGSRREMLIAQFHKIPEDWRGKMSPDGKTFWCRCPDKNHQTRSPRQGGTPSVRVNLTSGPKWTAGAWQCFSCGKHGGWHVLAKKYKKRGINVHPLRKKGKKGEAYYEEYADLDIGQYDEDELLGTTGPDQLPPEHERVPWDLNMEWRGINGKTVIDVGGCLAMSPYRAEAQLYLPSLVEGEEVGGVFCVLERKSKAELGYINVRGSWAKKNIMFYDHIMKLMKKRKYNRVLFVCEGPRDSLNLLQYGIAAVSILGARYAWSQEKADQILALMPDHVVLAFDPDEAGRAARKKAKAYLKKYVKVSSINWGKFKSGPKKGERKDGADLRHKRAAKIKRILGITTPTPEDPITYWPEKAAA